MGHLCSGIYPRSHPTISHIQRQMRREPVLVLLPTVHLLGASPDYLWLVESRTARCQIG
jgi:hypothetical protein